jgi:gamma-glutamylcyclotransferase (GGCT)/AIG2-like uncharacterized protein YtfP
LRLFLYGTLAALDALAHCGGQPLRSHPVPATLSGYRRVRLRGTRYPTLRRAPGRAIHGVVALVTAEELRRLTAYEAGRYRRIAVQVDTAHGRLRAACFFGDAPTLADWRPIDGMVAMRSRHF